MEHDPGAHRLTECKGLHANCLRHDGVVNSRKEAARTRYPETSPETIFIRDKFFASTVNTIPHRGSSNCDPLHLLLEDGGSGSPPPLLLCGQVPQI